MNEDFVLMHAPAGLGMISFSNGDRVTVDVPTGQFQCPRKFVPEALNAGCSIAGHGAPWGRPHAA